MTHHDSLISRQLGKLMIIFAAVIFLIFGVTTSLTDANLNLGLSHGDIDYLKGLFWAVLILISIFFWPISAAHKRVLALLWVARIGVTLGFMLFYESYYGLDAARYFLEALTKNNSFDPILYGAGTDNLISLVALHNQWIFESYHAAKVTWALMGLLAIYIIYRAACAYLRRDEIILLYLLGLFPSILFWSSILGKDPLTLLGIAIYIYGTVLFYLRRKFSYVFLIVLGVALAAFIRIWLAAIFIFPLGIFFLAGRGKLLLKLAFSVFITFALVFSMQLFQERFAIESAEDLVETTDTLSQNWAHGGSGQKIAGGFSSLGDMVTFMPLGIFTALFRPLPGEIFNLFGILAGLENLFLLVLVWRALASGGWRKAKEPLLTWAFLLIVVWAVVYGFVSYQNLGTAFRFRLQVTPLLLLLLLYLSNRSGQHFAKSCSPWPSTQR